MTLRKFLRFFKHFGYYMRKDFRWLKQKLSKKETSALNKSRKTKSSDENAMPKSLAKVLYKIKKDTNSDCFIKYGNKYYVPYANEPWNFYEIWRADDTIHITGVTTISDSRVCEDGMLSKWLSEVFVSYFDRSCDNEIFAIKIKSLNNAFMIKETKDDTSFYKIYVTYGSQRPRLVYTINYIDKENGTYETHIHSSKKGVDSDYLLSYFPMQVLKSIPIGKL